MTGGRANRFNDSCQGKTPPLQDLGRQEATGGPSQLPVAQSSGHSPPSLSLLQSSCLPFPAWVSDLNGPGERNGIQTAGGPQSSRSAHCQGHFLVRKLTHIYGI